VIRAIKTTGALRITYPAKGFTLIEALISMALLTVMLIGLDAMELSAMRTNRETYLFSVAANQLQIMEERLMLLAHHQDTGQQITLWNRENSMVLPDGRGSFDQSMLTVLWGEADKERCGQKQEGLSGCLQKRVAILE
jgi:prepilin-type N-terminal cleavage/methylation domain-containing protein